MHAVIVLPRFYPYRGGYENSLLAVGRCLTARGHRVTVFTTNADDLESLWIRGHKTFPTGQLIVDGITICRLAISHNALIRRAKRLAGLIPYWKWKAQYWRPGFEVPGLRAALREVEADVFHVGPLPYNNLMYEGIAAARSLGVPVIATPCAHFGEPQNSEVAQHYVSSYQIEMLRHCDRVHCMTSVEAGQLAARGVAERKLVVIGHGIDSDLATGGDGERIRRKYQIDGQVVLHLGMKAFDKGSVTLLDSMNRLWAEGSKAWLVMAGPSLNAFDEYVASRSPGCHRLVNLSAFADGEKRDLLAAATVVVQPSRVESLGLVLMEAWANAKPVIAADIDVSRYLVHQSGGGVIVPFGDSERLAIELARMLDDSEERLKMGTAGQKLAQSYDGKVLWPRNADLFEEVANGRVNSNG
jgi:glycosyltransferase involved in cell wall biosynthesis